MIYIGIDIGKKGGIACLPDTGKVYVYPMPVFGAKKILNLPEIIGIIGQWPQAEVRVYVERQQAFPGQGVTSMFGLGMQYGQILGILHTMEVRHQVITPQAWKKVVLAGTKKDKGAAIEFCLRQYPNIDLAPGRKRTPQDGLADAICIAEYGRLSEVRR